MEQIWLTWAKQLQAIASTGVHFSDDPYDRERYTEVAHIAQQMLSALGSVPIEKIEGLVTDFAKGYATPRIDVRGAVIQNDQILLVQEKTDGLWSLPGGYADVGLSAAENVAKEISEEANIQVGVSSLYSVRHKAKHAYSEDARDFYKFFFLCEQTDDADPTPGLETGNVGFFTLNELPALSQGRVIPEDITAAFHASRQAAPPALFD
jgi:ADP-ribose pyrophosphatase YjhB (NUDIX family)